MDTPKREDDTTPARKEMTFTNWLMFWNFEEERLKNYIEEYKEQEAHVQYCPYCIEPRKGRLMCCGESHWIDFNDFDDDTQMQIIMEEYDKAFRPRDNK
jgi:hypothetical protein